MRENQWFFIACNPVITLLPTSTTTDFIFTLTMVTADEVLTTCSYSPIADALTGPMTLRPTTKAFMFVVGFGPAYKIMSWIDAQHHLQHIFLCFAINF